MRDQLLGSQEQVLAIENDHRSTVETLQRQMQAQAGALEALRQEDGRVDASEGSLSELQGLNDQLLEALHDVREENRALSAEALAQVHTSNRHHNMIPVDGSERLLVVAASRGAAEYKR